MQYESKERQWFALGNCGNLYAIGDCGDFHAADEIVRDLEIDAIWLADYETAKQWHETIANKFAAL